MKRTLLALSLLAIAVTGFSQANQKGDFMIDIGFGGGIYMYDYEHTVADTTVETREDTAGTIFGLLDLEYSVTDWLALGVRFKSGAYVEDNPLVENKFNAFEIAGRFYFLNGDKFTLDGRIGFGTSSLREEGSINLGVFGTYSYSTKWSGTHTSLGVGFKWMLAEKVGLMLDYEFDIYRLDLKSYNVNGSDQDLSNRTWTYDVNGNELILALVIKL